MTFSELIGRMAEAAARGDGQAVTDCFTADGVYDDVFYGPFQGAAIKDMIKNYFHRDGCNFRWDMYDAVDNGSVGYARYVFSYESKLEGAKGKRALFEGVAICRLQDGKIAHYSEIANSATGLLGLGFPPERLAKFINKQKSELEGREEAAHHLT
ncbi:MAG: nuclear transport factor 2 family protein [Hyphomicrobiaceae bacterium TMED74]|nr:polyketide cyclase [Filomicrobium sp.]RPG48066.1 MAG: nuclear transport factor 2 family protein [Hyphomicrobiaceae bacterium TMED74]